MPDRPDTDHPTEHERHDHCGCCGRCFKWLRGDFCVGCRSPVEHLGPVDLPPWERTYEAVHGEPCPFVEAKVTDTDALRSLLTKPRPTRIPLTIITTATRQRTDGVLVAVLVGDLDAVESRLSEAEALLREAQAEIDRWGWGDFHYAPKDRDPGVVAMVNRIASFLDAGEGT